MEAKAKRLGATELRPSWRKGNKMVVSYRGHWYYFGAAGMSDYTQHGDPARRVLSSEALSYIAVDGRPAYTVKESPAYWSWHLLG